MPWDADQHEKYRATMASRRAGERPPTKRDHIDARLDRIEDALVQLARAPSCDHADLIEAIAKMRQTVVVIPSHRRIKDGGEHPAAQVKKVRRELTS